MNSSFSITTLQSVIYIAALVPFLIALIMWVAFYIKYDYGKLGKIEYVFKRLADDGEKIKECSKENISFMDEMIVRMAPTYFLETWIRMKMQLDKNYDGDYIPDGQSFYPFDSMITVPGCRNRMESMWKTFWVLGLLTVLLPVGAALFIQPEAILNALFLGVIIFVLSCVTYLIFTLIDQKSYFNTKTQYYRFINTFDRILPVAKPEVALLLEATQRNKETYESATGKIVEKFNNIVDDMILPVLEGSIYTIMHSNLIPAIHNIEKTLDDNMNKTMELQEKGMRDLASDFVDSLGNTISEKLKELAETINIVQNNMKLLNDNLNSQVNTLTQTISESLQAHQEHTAKTKEFQDQSLEHLKEHITNTIEFQNHSLELHKEQLNKAIEVQDGSLNRQKEFIAEAIALQNQALEIQKEHIIEAMKLQDQQMKQSLDLHEQSLSKITSSFSESFTNTVEARIADLAMTISGVGGQIDEFAFKLSNHVDEFMKSTKNSLKIQEEKFCSMMTFQDQRMDQIMDLHAESMSNIAVSFANSLEESLHGSLASLNQEFERLQIRMGAMNERLSVNIEKLTSMLESQNQIMEESAKLLTSSGEMQEKILLDVREIQSRAIENTDTMNNHVENMTVVLDKLTEQNTAFTNEAFKFTKDISEAQTRMYEEVKISQDKLEKAVNDTINQYAKMNSMISQMMDNITDRMNDAMMNAGREIASGIKEVTADNAAAIADLTEQSQNLRNDYETYFTRMENSTAKMIEEMDYQIRTITARITEDIGAMIENNIKANAEILERYKDNTTEILQSFDEQARSIGLYAKEINMDITELSGNLQSSVEEFSKKIQEGVHITLSEFDSGLSELTQRLANTVESISDAVEALPEAINKRNH